MKNVLIEEIRKSPIKLFLSLMWSSIVIAWILAIVWPNIQMDLFAVKGKDFFRDFLNNIGYIDNAVNVYTGEGARIVGIRPERTYPALAYFVFDLFRRCTAVPNHVESLLSVFSILFSCFSAVLTAILIFINFKGGNKVKLLFTFALLLSNPFLFLLERGNMLLLSLPLTMFYLFYFDSKDKFVKEIALLALAFAAGLKLSPAIFGLLLVIRKDWLSAARLVVYGLSFTLIPFLYFNGGLANLPLFLENTSQNGKAYFACHVGCEYWGNIMTYYGVDRKVGLAVCYLVFIVTGLISILFSFFAKERWLKIFLLTVAMLMFPLNSNFYQYVYFFPVLVCFFNETKHASFLTSSIVILFVGILNPIVIVDNHFTHALISLIFDILVLVVIIHCYRSNKSCFLLENLFKKIMKR